MNRHKKRLFLCVVCTLLVIGGRNAMAEKAPYTKEELQKTSTHIVVGKVQAIYSRKEKRGNYEYTHLLAEVKIDNVEKGEGPEGLLYARYLDIDWKGPGHVPPGPSGHSPRPEVGKSFRFYLSQDAYDGFNRDNKDGGYNILYRNGVEPIE